MIWSYDAAKFRETMSEEKHKHMCRMIKNNLWEMETFLARGVAQGVFKQ